MTASSLLWATEAVPEVYRVAVAQRRVLVTENWTDFRNLVGTRDDLGVIGVPGGWTRRQVDQAHSAVDLSWRPSSQGAVRAMVQRVITELLDDLDGSPAVETVRFGYAGQDYEIDLNEEHAAELDELLAPYIEHGRRVNGGKPARRGQRAEGQQRSPTELHAIRQWANEQGLQVSDRGRIAADILAKYDAAH